MKRTPLPTPNQNDPAFQAYRRAVHEGEKMFEERKENGKKQQETSKGK